MKNQDFDEYLILWRAVPDFRFLGGRGRGGGNLKGNISSMYATFDSIVNGYQRMLRASERVRKYRMPRTRGHRKPSTAPRLQVPTKQ